MKAFIVGCPRSGTTLLQAMLGAHPNIFTLPETHFFAKLATAERVATLNGGAPRSIHRVLGGVAADLGLKIASLGDASPQECAQEFVRLLSRATDEADASTWVEKTPRHLHVLSLIERHVPDAVFIHIVRPGQDVVASLMDVSRRYPEWWGGPISVEVAVSRWNHDAEITRRRLDGSRHLLVWYPHLVEEPQQVLSPLIAALGIEFDPVVVRDYRASARRVTRADEPWKTGAQEAIRTERRPRTALAGEDQLVVQCRLAEFPAERFAEIAPGGVG